jgi:hypothetical protein
MRYPQVSQTLLFLLLLAGSVGFAQPSEKVQELWSKTMTPLLEQPLWLVRDAYDTTHALMVPMHAAFALGEEQWQAEFAAFFSRLEQVPIEEVYAGYENEEIRLQFMYLVSQYLVIHKEQALPVPEHLLTATLNAFETIWTSPAWQWPVCGMEEFPTMEARIRWRLDTLDVPKSYCRVIIDAEGFVLSIAADLSYLYADTAPATVKNALDLFVQAMEQEIVWLDDTRILVQPGGWRDHPDYLYAGWVDKAPNLEANPIADIAVDTSHSHRWPLWLFSFERAMDTDQKAWAQQLRLGFANQFASQVLIAPSDDFPNYRTTNFMDGRNGLYRYKYKTQAEKLGFAAYELSGTFLLGWWSSLSNPTVTEAYCYIAASFPMSDEEITLYLGPDTTRERNPFFTSEAPYHNGLYELISNLACLQGEQQ